MKKTLARGAGAIGGAAALLALFGAGSASAVNEYAGQTYADAASSISGWGTPVVATRVGSFLPTDQCMVSGSRDASFLDGSGQSRGGIVLLDLNCNAATAASGHPGNSTASPEGAAAKLMRDRGVTYSEDYDEAVAAGEDFWCGASEAEVQWCQRVCTEGGTCSEELAQYLGI